MLAARPLASRFFPEMKTCLSTGDGTWAVGSFLGNRSLIDAFPSMSILAHHLSRSPLVSLLLFLLRLLCAMSSSSPAIVDREVLESDHNMYEVHFEGRTIHTLLTYSPTVASSWLSSHSSEQLVAGSSRGSEHLVIGLGIEWLAGPEGVRNPVAILQLSVGDDCLIFQLLHSSNIPQALTDFLSNDRHIFVGVEIAKDVDKLVRDYRLSVRNARDLRSLANNAGVKLPRDCGLKEMAKLILGWKMEKRNRVTVSQWNKLWLTSAQVRYACIDAFVSLQIGKVLYSA